MGVYKYTPEQIRFVLDMSDTLDWTELAAELRTVFGVEATPDALRCMVFRERRRGPLSPAAPEAGSKSGAGPRVLIFDIETAPILAHVWALWDQNVGLNQIQADWFVLSWAAKWLGSPASEVMYMDQRGAAKLEDDRELLEAIWKLLDEADIVVTQNGRSFDQRKLQARFLLQGMQPPSAYKHIDTKLLTQKHFAFPSHKLEYMTEKLCKKWKKLKHKKFPGHEMWVECMRGNLAAWREMEKYNRHDVLSLEELYTVIRPWDASINFSLWHEDTGHVCSCGSREFQRRGYAYTPAGKFQVHRCKKCGSEVRDKQNLLSKEKRASLRTAVPR